MHDAIVKTLILSPSLDVEGKTGPSSSCARGLKFPPCFLPSLFQREKGARILHENFSLFPPPLYAVQAARDSPPFPFPSAGWIEQKKYMEPFPFPLPRPEKLGDTSGFSFLLQGRSRVKRIVYTLFFFSLSSSAASILSPPPPSTHIEAQPLRRNRHTTFSPLPPLFLFAARGQHRNRTHLFSSAPDGQEW